MIFLYSMLLLLLGVAKFLMKRKVAALEQKYVKAARGAETFLRLPFYKEGNGRRPDPYQDAKRQYELGCLVQKRDRLEDRYHAWQATFEKFGRFVADLGTWKGKKLPYTFGVLDVWCVLSLIDYLGVGEYVSARYLIGLVASHFTR